jgi:hypothetical protein
MLLVLASHLGDGMELAERPAPSVLVHLAGWVLEQFLLL